MNDVALCFGEWLGGRRITVLLLKKLNGILRLRSYRESLVEHDEAWSAIPGAFLDSEVSFYSDANPILYVVTHKQLQLPAMRPAPKKACIGLHLDTYNWNFRIGLRSRFHPVELPSKHAEV